MAFESVRGYVELASGLSDLTRARAKEAALGLLSLPSASITSGGKMAVQASALADELLAAAAANRLNLTKLVRSEVDIAITRLGLVSVQQLEEAQAEAARLRAEVTRLRSASPKAPAAPTTPKAAAAKPAVKKPAVKKPAVKKAAVKQAAVKKAAVKKAAPSSASASKATVSKSTAKKASAQTSNTATKAAAGRSAVTTRAKSAGR